MPELDLSQFENIPPNELEQQRREIIAKAKGVHDNLSIDDLHLLAAITGVLRRKASGPPKAVKTPGAKRSAKPAPAALDDLA